MVTPISRAFNQLTMLRHIFQNKLMAVSKTDGFDEVAIQERNIFITICDNISDLKNGGGGLLTLCICRGIFEDFSVSFEPVVPSALEASFLCIQYYLINFRFTKVYNYLSGPFKAVTLENAYWGQD